MNEAKIESQYAAVVVSLSALAHETGWEGQTVRDWTTELEEIQNSLIFLSEKTLVKWLMGLLKHTPLVGMHVAFRCYSRILPNVNQQIRLKKKKRQQGTLDV